MLGWIVSTCTKSISKMASMWKTRAKNEHKRKNLLQHGHGFRCKTGPAGTWQVSRLFLNQLQKHESARGGLFGSGEAWQALGYGSGWARVGQFHGCWIRRLELLQKILRGTVPSLKHTAAAVTPACPAFLSTGPAYVAVFSLSRLLRSRGNCG